MRARSEAYVAEGSAIQNSFEATVLDAVDNGLAVLGESVRGAVYYHVERSFGIRREEIPKRLEAFHEALGRLLGEGARVVERLVVRNLYGRLGLDFEEHQNWALVDYVDYAAKAKGGH